MAVVLEVSITDLQHPYYVERILEWRKWRLTYEGGYQFLRFYLERFTLSEDPVDFEARKRISYVAAFAKAAVTEVRNSIYQRLSDITREDGSKTYQAAVEGAEGGVDLLGSSMNTFMGTEVLPELLVMDRVGIYIDMPPRVGPTLADNANIRPYLYVYKAEDIRSWVEDDSPSRNQFRAVLLRDYVYEYDKATGLPIGEVERFRYYWKDELGKVWVKFYNNENEVITPEGEIGGEPILLNITKIPFVLLELGGSLMTDIADYQIALTNLASADMSYAIRANFPFYTEQYDPRFSSPHLKRPAVTTSDELGNIIEVPAQSEEIDIGPTSGRRYPKGTERPGFIHPSPEPLRASMEKQEQLKREIRLLINLSIANIQPKMASAESKGMDERTLESGLSYIGLLMEDAERQIAQLWTEYEGGRNSTNVATVHYPQKYNLRSEEDRRREVKSLKELSDIVPSDTYRREIGKQIATIMLSAKVPSATLQKIHDEIDNAPVVNVIPEQILLDVEAGLVDPETASAARGYPEGSVEAAQEYQAKRLALIQKSQTPGNPAARGIPDAAINPAAEAAVEKDNKPVRGPGQVESNSGDGNGQT